MDNPSFKPAINLGLIMLAVSVLFVVSAYAIDLTLMTNMYIGIILILLWMVILVLSPVQTRKQAGGLISFKHAFAAVMITFLVCSVPSTLVTYTLFGVIDQDAAAKIEELQIESSIDMMRRFGAPEEQIDEQVDYMGEMDQFALSTQLMGLLRSFVFVAIYGLIIAAIVKKKKTEFE